MLHQRSGTSLGTSSIGSPSLGSQPDRRGPQPGPNLAHPLNARQISTGSSIRRIRRSLWVDVPRYSDSGNAANWQHESITLGQTVDQIPTCSKGAPFGRSLSGHEVEIGENELELTAPGAHACLASRRSPLSVAPPVLSVRLRLQAGRRNPRPQTQSEPRRLCRSQRSPDAAPGIGHRRRRPD